jgi:hypothetical protein
VGQDSFPGLLGVVHAYLDSLNVEFTAKLKLQKYLDLIKRRADGVSLYFVVPTRVLIVVQGHY